MALARLLRLDTLRLEQDGRVVTAAFANPPHNFIGLAFLRDLERLVTVVTRDRTVGAVILTGAPEDRYLTHYDVDELAAAAETPTPQLSPALGTLVITAGMVATATPIGKTISERVPGPYAPLGLSLSAISRLHNAVRRMHRSGVVFIAAINGPCLGGGLEISSACDLRLAASEPDVVLGQPEILAGILPGGGGTQHLPRLMGTGKALEFILEGGTVSAREAERLGLVNAVVPRAELMDLARRTAQRLSSRSKTAVAVAKRAVYQGSSLSLRLGMLIEAGGLLAAGKTPTSRALAKVFTADLHRLGDTPFLAEPDPWLNGLHPESQFPVAP